MFYHYHLRNNIIHYYVQVAGCVIKRMTCVYPCVSVKDFKLSDITKHTALLCSSCHIEIVLELLLCIKVKLEI